jgi:CHAT domain-containing protein
MTLFKVHHPISSCLLVPQALQLFAVSAAFLSICATMNGQSAADLLSRAQKLYEQGDGYRASPLFVKAEQQFRTLGDRRDELAAKFGRLHTDADHGNYNAVKAEVERDLQTQLVQNDPQLKIEALALLGIIDLNIDTAAAGADWKQVLETATATGDLKWQNRARGELGIVAGVSGNIGAAGMALFKAIATAEQIGDAGGAINFRTWLANGMTVNGMADGALKQLDKASDLAQRSGFRQMPFQLSIAKIRAIAMLPEPARSQRIEEARALFTSTLRLAENEKVYGAEIELLNQEGQLAYESGNMPMAEQAFFQAAQIAKAAELPGLEAEANLQLVRLYLQMKQPQKAAVCIKQGMRDVEHSEDSYDLPLFVAAEAETEAALNHVAAADKLYDGATTLLEGLLVNAPSSGVKSSMIAAFSRIYVAHFRLAWEQQHDQAKAFQIIESARGRVLLDSIRYSQRSPSTTSVSPAENRIAALQRTLIQRKMSATQAKQVLAQLDDAYDQLGSTQFAQERKEVSVLRRAPITLSALMRLLGPHQVFLEYVLDLHASYALEISAAGMRVHILPPGEQIAGLTKKCLAAIKAGTQDQTAARALYSALIGPIADREWDSLIVVPDGSLHLLPWGALQNESGSYLAQRAVISVAPSATVLGALRREPEVQTAKLFLGVAFSPTSEEPAKAADMRGIADIRGADVKPLPFSKEEVTDASAAMGKDGIVLQGSDASEAALKAEPLAQFKIIHLAAHGVGDETQPDRAAIVLHPGSASEDGLWQAREIRRTRLNADAVVLSACETGTGRLQGEEGITNLARAFLTAGAKSVVASLWDVQDRSTATLMEGFYQHLAKGESIATALRSSQVDFIKTYGEKTNPSLWAGFEVIGDGTRTIATNTRQAQLQAARTHLR